MAETVTVNMSAEDYDWLCDWLSELYSEAVSDFKARVLTDRVAEIQRAEDIITTEVYYG